MGNKSTSKKKETKANWNQLFPTNKFRVFDSLGLPQTVSWSLLLSTTTTTTTSATLLLSSRQTETWPATPTTATVTTTTRLSLSDDSPSGCELYVGSNSVRLSGMPRSHSATESVCDVHMCVRVCVWVWVTALRFVIATCGGSCPNSAALAGDCPLWLRVQL